MAEQGAPEPPPLTLQEAAGRHGAYRWIEQRLFELTGAWSAGPGLPPAVRVHLFEASAQHAAHAGQWFARLPVLATLDREAVTRPAGPVVGPLLAHLAAGGDGGDGAGEAPAGDDQAAGLCFVAGLYRVVLPLLLDSYRRHGERLSPVADEPSRRTLAAVLRAEEVELAAAVALLDEAGADAGPGTALEGAMRGLRGVVDALGTATGELVPWSDAHCAW